MTLAEMADFISSKVRQTDAEAVAACKTYLGRRWHIIYDDQLWKDSLYTFEFTMQLTDPIAGEAPNSAELAAAGIWFLPLIVDKVVAVRSAVAEMGVVSEEQWYRSDIDAYEQTGEPVNFCLLPPAVYQTFDPAALCLFWTGGTNDNGTSVEVVYIDANERKHKKTIVVTDTAQQIESVVSGILLVESVTKPITTLELIMSDIDLLPIPSVRALPAETEIQRFPRIRVSPAPSQNRVMRVLCKQKITPLENDTDTPSLAGVENILLAFCHGDMLERGRQYAKASMKHQEALGLLEQYKRQQTHQRAHNARLIPQIYEQSGGGQTEWPSKGYW